MSANVNFMWCLQCPSGQIHVSGDAQPIMQCQACNSRACFTHKVPWHNGYTCKEYDKLLKSTRATTFSSLTERTPFLNLARFSRSRLSLFQRPSGQPSKRIEKGDEYVIDGCAMTALDVERLRQEKEVTEAITRRNQEEENSKKTIRKVCKICPGKGCNWPIEKNDGCAHMTCKIPLSISFFSSSFVYASSLACFRIFQACIVLYIVASVLNSWFRHQMQQAILLAMSKEVEVSPSLLVVLNCPLHLFLLLPLLYRSAYLRHHDSFQQFLNKS
jgi:hypothetical protein